MPHGERPSSQDEHHARAAKARFGADLQLLVVLVVGCPHVVRLRICSRWALDEDEMRVVGLERGVSLGGRPVEMVCALQAAPRL